MESKIQRVVVERGGIGTLAFSHNGECPLKEKLFETKSKLREMAQR